MLLKLSVTLAGLQTGMIVFFNSNLSIYDVTHHLNLAVNTASEFSKFPKFEQNLKQSHQSSSCQG